MLSRLTSLLRRVIGDRRGNVLMIFGLTLLPLTFATGMGIDYARAMRLQNKLDAAADAAALGAVSKIAMNGGQAYSAMVKQYAQQLFIVQTQRLLGAGGLTINYADPSQFNVTITDTVTGNIMKRIATVTYQAQSSNAFANILGLASLTIKGNSQATASSAPNIDFYIMMDVSPSMLLPATTSGLNQMVALSGNCAFACHITNSTTDNYSMARNNNIVLRTDLVAKAVSDLTSTATSISSKNGATYRMGLMDFDYSHRQLWPQVSAGATAVDANLSNVQAHVADAVIQSYYSNGTRVSGQSSLGDNDTATSFTNAMTGAGNFMPANAGTGTNQSGDTPQAILFIITDGMRDEAIGDNTGNRIMGPIPTSLCDSIKSRQNTRIAILYTQYLPESASDDWSKSNVLAPFLSPNDKISPALTSCASPGLFYQVTTNDDVSAALAQLFQQAVASAHIIQ